MFDGFPNEYRGLHVPHNAGNDHELVRVVWSVNLQNLMRRGHLGIGHTHSQCTNVASA